MDNMSPLNLLSKVDVGSQEGMNNTRDTGSHEQGAEDAFAQTLHQQMQSNPEQSPNQTSASVKNAAPTSSPKPPISNKSQETKTAKAEASKEELASATEETSALNLAEGYAESDAQLKKLLLVKDKEPMPKEVQEAPGQVDSLVSADWLASMIELRQNTLPSNKRVETNLTTESSEVSSISTATPDAPILVNALNSAQTSDKPITPILTRNVEDNALLAKSKTEPLANLTQSADKAKNSGPLTGKGAIVAAPTLVDTSADFDARLLSPSASPELALAGKAPMTEFSAKFMEQLQQIDVSSTASMNKALTTTNLTQDALNIQTPVMTADIDVPFGLKGWQQSMNNQVMRMTQQGSELATLTLSPPDLGPVQVVLRLENQSVDTAFISDNPNVRQALEDGLQDLKERMQSQGLQLGNAFVGNGNQAKQHFEAQSASTADGNAPVSLTEDSPSTVGLGKARLGLVDTFA